MFRTIKIGFVVCLLSLLAACVNSPLGADAQVNLYTWDNRVVPFFATQTYRDEGFQGLFDGAILLGDLLRQKPDLDIRPDTPYLLEVCDDAGLCYYLVLFPGDFLRTEAGAIAGYAVVTEVSTAVYYQVKDLDAAYVRDAVDELAAAVMGDDLSDDEEVDYSDMLRLDHFDRGNRKGQLRDPGIVDRLREKLASGEDETISEATPIELEDEGSPLDLFDPACFENPDAEDCVPPEPEDLCGLAPDDPRCGRIPAVHCLLFPDQPPCEELSKTDFCLENPDEALCRGLRLDELCIQDPTDPVCMKPVDPVHCAEYPKDPFCTGFPDFEECLDDPLNPLCGEGFFDEFCAMAPGEDICEKPPVDEVCLVNSDSVFCDRPDEDDFFCDVNPDHPECMDDEPPTEEEDFCEMNPEHPECMDEEPPAGQEPPPGA